MKYVAVALIAACVAFGGQAPAPQTTQKPRDPKKAFARLDTNGDGKVSLEEFKARGKDPAKREKRFNKLDTNHDGFLSMEEFAAGYPAR